MDKAGRVQGCVLALAVGDALGLTVEDKSLGQILEDYGPQGLRGYDLVNGYAAVSSYTQLLAWGCNGLLVGLTRGRLRGVMAPYVRYLELAGRDWANCQRRRGSDSICWVSRQAPLQHRATMEQLMPDSYLQQTPSTMEAPRNRFRTPGSLSLAVAAGVTLDPKMVPRQEIARVGAEAVALTHGHPMAFLSGACLAWLVNTLVYEGVRLDRELVEECAGHLRSRYSSQYRQAGELSMLLQSLPNLGRQRGNLWEKLEILGCDSADRVLAGALLCLLNGENDPEEALTASVNHSGRSAACGSVTGALLGASQGVSAIGEFYLECLEPRQVLLELADDVLCGCPMGRDSGLFDLEWDRKYVQMGR